MLERGRYGIEWTVRPRSKTPSVAGWFVSIVVILSIVSFAVSYVKNKREVAREMELNDSTAGAECSPKVSLPEANVQTDVRPPIVAPPVVNKPDLRPPKMRNLMMRLEEAEKARDVELAATTIEELRALPGSPAADIDDKLARRLGDLNMRRLFERKSALWVKTIEVRRGDTPSRIATDHGSTFEALKKLNNDSLDRIRIGQKLLVLDRPRFNLVVRRSTRTIDVHLNGKFFKRYDLQNADNLKDGATEWREVSLALLRKDRDELKMLLPRNAPVLISEM